MHSQYRSTRPVRTSLRRTMAGPRTPWVAAWTAVAAALFAVIGPSTPAESSPADTGDPAPGRSTPDGSVACRPAVVMSPDPPTAHDPCLEEWRRFQRYLATLPRLIG
jgi:hypothetical protein